MVVEPGATWDCTVAGPRANLGMALLWVFGKETEGL